MNKEPHLPPPLMYSTPLIIMDYKRVKVSRYRHVGDKGERYSSNSFLTSALVGWVISVAPRPSFTPGERTPGTHCTGGWVALRAGVVTEARVKSFAFTGDRTLVVQYAVISHWIVPKTDGTEITPLLCLKDSNDMLKSLYICVSRSPRCVRYVSVRPLPVMYRNQNTVSVKGNYCTDPDDDEWTVGACNAKDYSGERQQWSATGVPFHGIRCDANIY
jgi:hypothetical protein